MIIGGFLKEGMPGLSLELKRRSVCKVVVEGEDFQAEGTACLDGGTEAWTSSLLGVGEGVRNGGELRSAEGKWRWRWREKGLGGR